jgi:hypothetical protein
LARSIGDRCVHKAIDTRHLPANVTTCLNEHIWHAVDYYIHNKMDSLGHCIHECHSLLHRGEHDALAQQLTQLTVLVDEYEVKYTARSPSDVVTLLESVVLEDEVGPMGVAVACDILCELPVASCQAFADPLVVR